MFEKRNESLIPTRKFLIRLLYSFSIGSLFIIIAMFVGMLGYHYFENMSWVDAFVNAAMILSGMGPLSPLVHNSGKIFAGLYALFSGLVFIAIIGVILAPIAHRFLHKFNIDEKEKSPRKK